MAPRLPSCALCVALLGCGSDLIEHAPQDPDPSATTGFPAFGSAGPSTDVTTGGSDGNFPEPALTRCGALDDGTYPIERLRSAWAVVAVGGTEDDEGEVEPGTMRLRLSDEVVLDCQDPLEVGGWGLALTLAPGEAVVGERPLDSLFAPELELVQGGESKLLPMTASLELVRVTQDCLVGVLSSVAIDGAPAPELSGGFAAELCARTCLPTATHGC